MIGSGICNIWKHRDYNILFINFAIIDNLSSWLIRVQMLILLDNIGPLYLAMTELIHISY